MANAYCLKDLRWLLRRGSPLPIPNREVKPDCADGTAVMWESMSLPFFSNPDHTVRVIFFIGAACPFGRSTALPAGRLFLESPHHLFDGIFCFVFFGV